MKQSICHRFHSYVNKLPRYTFPLGEEIARIPLNGIYIMFEKGEWAHGGDRIVRVGTHTGDSQLKSRLNQHCFSRKDRSILRKNIGRCILNSNNDKYLRIWNYDLTTKRAKTDYLRQVDLSKEQIIEEEISKYIKEKISFVFLNVENKQKRLELESKIVSTVSRCQDCGPSKMWFGKYSPKKKIEESGLWQVNELYKEPLTEMELQDIVK